MKRWLALALFAALVAYLCTGIYQVRAGELAVVRRFGRVQEQPRLPGLHFGLPWGLDRVDRIAMDEHRELTVGYHESETPPDTAAAGQLLTADNNLVDIRATVYYRIEREHQRAVVQYVLNRERIEPLLERSAEEALGRVLSQQQVDAVLQGRTRGLEQQLQERIGRTLAPYDLGIEILNVNLVYVKPPAELGPAFNEVTEARNQKEIKRTEALNQRQTTVALARNQAREVETAAHIEHDRRVEQARAKAGSLLALWEECKKTPDPKAALLARELKRMTGLLNRSQNRTINDPQTPIDITIFMPF